MPGVYFHSLQVFREQVGELVAFPGGSVVKKKKIAWSPGDMQETRVQSLNQENPLEKEMVIHCSLLA